ncbi:MAG: ABC-F family ATP-binding cassette domain-containing protein, partial [Lachnospiraceae bacterium]|nr:ABC-F family ATP-binding cassette domain-containing protein [Lachnospiraceae bacterium]
TNHLDITSREILEETLSRYEGTLLFISHDRYFINRLAQRIWELKDGQLTEYLGNYDDYLEKKKASPAEEKLPEDASESDSARDRRIKKEEQSQRRRKENEIKRLEESIEETEGKLQALEAEMARPEVAVDPDRLLQLDTEARALRETLEAYYLRWESLAE